MPTIKIYPPTKLPNSNVSETQFAIWQEELEVYLSQESDFKLFLPNKSYGSWLSYEENPDRILELKQEDQTVPNANRDEGRIITNAEAILDNTEKLENIRINLRTVLSIVGKCVNEGHYNSVIKHATSLQWIYDMLRSDYDIKSKGVHFFNILEVKYDANKHTPISFYNLYRTIVSNNLAKQGDIIKHKNNETLERDEKFSPMFEDMILLNVIRDIDPRLPILIKNFYFHKMAKDERLMDYKTDILLNIPKFMQEINEKQEDANLNVFKKVVRNRNQIQHAYKNKNSKQRRYCRLCHLSKKPREIFTSHSFGDNSCHSLSAQDRQSFINSTKLSAVQEDSNNETDEDELAELYGYQKDCDIQESDESSQVETTNTELEKNISFNRNDTPKCGYIQPVSSQILTVFTDEKNAVPFHIELDSGATVSYVRESVARRFNFIIKPNNQLFKLGDGITKLRAIGEIKVDLFRNAHKFVFHAIVCNDLTSDAIGGTNFLQDNSIEQDLKRNVIFMDNRKISIIPTNHSAIMQTVPILDTNEQVNLIKPSQLLTFQSRVLLPDQHLDVPINIQDGSVVAIESWEHNNDATWPEAQLQTINNGMLKLCNRTRNPIHLGKDVKRCKVRSTSNANCSQPSYYTYIPNLNHTEEISESTLDIDLTNIKSNPVKQIITEAHDIYRNVFDKDLTGGYNAYYGQHRCRLNWATTERPSADKVRVPNYNHALKGLQQELMDDLTDQGVLLIPQDHDIQVQSVCPSFIQRKQRAKNKPENQLTKNDVRLLINFGPINEKIKPVPINVTKPDDILISLGKWKHVIIFDLYNGYFQNHMADDDIPWLGVQTPFGGLRVMSRSGQGLSGMAEEFDELMAKILKEEMKDGICAKIVDDCYVGGTTQMEAAMNYKRILKKLHNANMKITPEKTYVFPKEADVLGWVWKEGGYLQPSPHRQLALTNTKVEDIVKVKDMRSWVGLFKTLHIATPDICSILAPFEAASAGKDTNDKIEWTHKLETEFRKAKDKIKQMVTLYLPSPNEQLILQTDASKQGLGHILYAKKDNKKVPVRIHSIKIPEKCRKWCPCETESLGLAAGIEKEFGIIRENNNPLIVETDSKPVFEAINLINRGKFSASARMSSILTNINRTPIKTRHISGKAKLNPIADLQSRLPPECTSEYCSIRKFLNDAVDSIIEDGPKINSMKQNDANNTYATRSAWKNAQKSNQAINATRKLLTSGKPPPKATGKHTGDYWNDVRKYWRDSTIAKDGVLVVNAEANAMSGNIHRERIVIPKPLVPALLYHMHNNTQNHPTKTQQKSLFQRQFYALNLDKHLDALYGNCYKCSIVQKIPKEIIVNETKTEAKQPHEHFHVDVIKRARQNIMVVRDHFSSYQDATFVESEKTSDLKEGIINLTTAIRKPGTIYVTADNAPGFSSLFGNKDTDLQKLNITMIKTDELNKNANAVVDKACQELEEEIKRIDPEGENISMGTLKLAVLNLNTRLRRKGRISAYEMNTARDQNTGENLNLND